MLAADGLALHTSYSGVAIGANPANLQYFMSTSGLFAEIPAGLQDFAYFSVAGGEAG
ncbi:MAG: hypothetical protein E6230_02065 [Paenibacillus dendritiformis]|uniref:hypothetical protein n=1 Tax=uncultured Paenibacillus sp. TaxID=227322 RepID=UPI0025F42C51|nr:hypothetical protein [uncultured Paenibacillus sp.]MDU5140956.1 hypothetical protein [Paenibacillus dendritiformis]